MGKDDSFEGIERIVVKDRSNVTFIPQDPTIKDFFRSEYSVAVKYQDMKHCRRTGDKLEIGPAADIDVYPSHAQLYSVESIGGSTVSGTIPLREIAGDGFERLSNTEVKKFSILDAKKEAHLLNAFSLVCNTVLFGGIATIANNYLPESYQLGLPDVIALGCGGSFAIRGNVRGNASLTIGIAALAYLGSEANDIIGHAKPAIESVQHVIKPFAEYVGGLIVSGTFKKTIIDNYKPRSLL